MSKIVTFDQAERLERLGFDDTISHYYELEDGKWGITNTLDKDFKDFFIRYPDERSIIRLAPTVSEALDWIREEKGIDCCAFYMIETIANRLNKTLWYIKYGIADQETIYNSYNVDYKYYYTHPLAESALLDAVLIYLEKK